MALDAICPECDATYVLPDEQKGKKVRCKKCHAVFLVTGRSSSRRPDEDDDDRSRISDRSRTQRMPATPPRTQRMPASPPRSSGPRRRDEEDDYDDRDDYDRREDREGKSKAPLIITAILGVLILAGGGIGLVFALKDDKKDDSKKTAQATNPPAVPAQPINNVVNPPPVVNPPVNPPNGNPLDPIGIKPPDNPPVGIQPPSNPPTGINPPPEKPPEKTTPDKSTGSKKTRKKELAPEEIDALKRATVFIKVQEADGSRASGSGFFGCSDAAHIVLILPRFGFFLIIAAASGRKNR
jgi:predicted Zn finger-like uncharacterized protein